MKVFVEGQEAEWINQLRQICRERQIDIVEDESQKQKADLLVTDSCFHRGRELRRDVPFLVISQKGDEESILEAFGQGAEDYLVFPVSPKIAAVRIEGILKRYGYGKFRIPFTPNEYRLISYMMRHPYHVLSREQLLKQAFFHGYRGIDRNVDNYVK